MSTTDDVNATIERLTRERDQAELECERWAAACARNEAECAALREALEAVRSQAAGHADEFSGNVARIAAAALSRPPGSREALEAWGDRLAYHVEIETIRLGSLSALQRAECVARLLREGGER